MRTDTNFYRELVTNQNHEACILIHSKNHALGNPLSSRTENLLRDHARLNPQELCLFEAHVRSNGATETPLPQAIKQKIVANHETYQDKTTCNVIKDWPITRGEIIRTKNQMLEDSIYAQQQSKLKGPDGSSLGVFIKQTADAIERACYTSPDQIEFGSDYQLSKYKDAIKQYQQPATIPTIIASSTSTFIPAKATTLPAQDQSQNSLITANAAKEVNKIRIYLQTHHNFED